MSEFWVSKKKYWCKYCDIYIADDAPSRQQHENGLRHQGNKARFVRDIYKTSERKKRDLEEEQREMVRVKQAANDAYANDVLSGNAGPSSSASASTSAAAAAPAARPKPARPADAYSNYSTAESLGYIDEEANALAAEKALKLNEGRAGDWTVVPVLPVDPTPESEVSSAAAPEVAPPEDADDVRGWKFGGDNKRRRIAIGLGDIYDPGVIKVKKKEGETPLTPKADEDPAGSGATAVPQWTPRTWLKPGEAPAKSDSRSPAPEPPPPSSTKTEEAERTEPPAELKPESPAVKVEEGLGEAVQNDTPPSSSGMFRKRKAPASGAGNRGSRR